MCGAREAPRINPFLDATQLVLVLTEHKGFAAKESLSLRFRNLRENNVAKGK
jgi:hypothetical protein